MDTQVVTQNQHPLIALLNEHLSADTEKILLLSQQVFTLFSDWFTDVMLLAPENQLTSMTHVIMMRAVIGRPFSPTYVQRLINDFNEGNPEPILEILSQGDDEILALLEKDPENKKIAEGFRYWMGPRQMVEGLGQIFGGLASIFEGAAPAIETDHGLIGGSHQEGNELQEKK